AGTRHKTAGVGEGGLRQGRCDPPANGPPSWGLLPRRKRHANRRRHPIAGGWRGVCEDVAIPTPSCHLQRSTTATPNHFFRGNTTTYRRLNHLASFSRFLSGRRKPPH